MNTSIPNDEPVLVHQKNLRQTVLILYLLFIAGLFTGMLTALLAMILAYVKKKDAAGTMYSSHINWLITVCWTNIIIMPITGLIIMLLFFMLYSNGNNWSAGILFLTGACMFIGVILWSIYRIVKGLLRWSGNRAVA